MISVLSFGTAAAAADGPLGRAPDISVGVSDAVLLAVSVAGFVALTVLVYSIVLTRLKTVDEIGADGDDDAMGYNERLLRADVSKLSRAQRRARARHIMKQQRRQQPAGVPQDRADNGNGAEENNGPNNMGAIVAADADDGSIRGVGVPSVSRRERQKAAKAAEREERALYEEERRREQLAAQHEAQIQKQQREKNEAERLRIEKTRRMQQREEDERRQYESWRFFLPPERVSDDRLCRSASDSQSEPFTVQSFRNRCRWDRVVRTDVLAEELGCSSDTIHHRIDELVGAGRLSGMLDTGTCRFLYLTQGQLASIASRLEERERVSLQDVLDEVGTETGLS